MLLRAALLAGALWRLVRTALLAGALGVILWAALVAGALRVAPLAMELDEGAVVALLARAPGTRLEESRGRREESRGLGSGGTLTPSLEATSRGSTRARNRGRGSMGGSSKKGGGRWASGSHSRREAGTQGRASLHGVNVL